MAAKPMFSLELRGAKELDRVLRALGPAAKAPLRRVMREAAEPVRAEFQASAPRSAGGGEHAADTMMVANEEPRTNAVSLSLGPGASLNIDQEGGLSISSSKASGDVAVSVGPSKEGFYLRFLEYGTSTLAPRPWARPAWERTKMQALQIIREGLWREIEKTVARLARKR